MIRNFLIHTVAIAIVFYILPISVTGNTYLEKGVNVFVISVILGALNLIIRPILGVIASPITILTLGLFSIVLNAAMIKIADILLNTFYITGFWNYIIFAALLSLVSIGLGIFKDND
jgi:putative membrane protein